MEIATVMATAGAGEIFHPDAAMPSTQSSEPEPEALPAGLSDPSPENIADAEDPDAESDLIPETKIETEIVIETVTEGKAEAAPSANGEHLAMPTSPAPDRLETPTIDEIESRLTNFETAGDVPASSPSKETSIRSGPEISSAPTIFPVSKVESLEGTVENGTSRGEPPVDVGRPENDGAVATRPGESVADDDDDDYNFITRVSTEDLMKAYDRVGTHALRKSAPPPRVSAAADPIMNDSQLLAILEGDEATPSPVSGGKSRRSRSRVLDPAAEKALALRQLKEMPTFRRKRRDGPPRIVDVKIPKVELRAREASPSPTAAPVASVPSAPPPETETATTVSSPKKSADPGDISFIMEDWNDEEAESAGTASAIPAGETDRIVENSEASEPAEIRAPDDDAASAISRRAQRIIKKKIIFDPDNPQTHKYASAAIRRAPSADGDDVERRNGTPASPEIVKKAASPEIVKKAAPPETAKRAAPPTPVEPSKKKKMSEIDRLLMDEGAINMIYQLERSNGNSDVPEIRLEPDRNSMISKSKEKKTLLSKAKIIKKAVLNRSSDSSDAAKTFRSRKESGASEARVAGGEKNRTDARSPSVSERPVGDESRIIRRHSSSSFSSGCLSPRPQSPADIGPDERRKPSIGEDSVRVKADEGMTPPISPKKRGRPRKTYARLGEKTKASSANNYSQLTLNVFEKVAHIKIKPTANSKELFDIQVLTELNDALKVGNRADAILLTSSDGAFCSGLDLREVLNDSAEKRKEIVSKLISAYRNLIMTMYNSPAAIVIGVGGSCAGFGVTLLTFSDLVLASDSATFCAAPRYRRRLPPEGGILLTNANSLSKQTSRELLLCGRKLTASEALQRGLVARTLWPDRFEEELKSITLDIANQPSHSFDIIKRVLRYQDSTDISNFLKYECRLLSEYWSSPEGQEAIRETLKDV